VKALPVGLLAVGFSTDARTVDGPWIHLRMQGERRSAPSSPHMRSECAILAGMARATLPESKTP
jgi:hypothetical protein